MKKFIYSLKETAVLKKQLPIFAVSLILTEMFFKLGSFALEVIAFGGLWFLLDLIVSKKNDS